MPRRSETRLTKRVVDALEADGKDTLFWDRDLPGFGVRVYSTGRKVYVVQSRGLHGPKRVTLGRHGALSTEEARKSAALLIDRIKRGEEPNPEAPETAPTVEELAERFMSDYVGAHCKPGTAPKYRSVLDNHVLPALGTKKLAQVGGAEVTALHHQLRETPRMANTVVDVLSRMFTLAEAWDLAPPGQNPCRRVRRYRMRPRERFLTVEEYRRLGRALGKAEGSLWPPALAAIRLLALTGCRREEVLNLRWDDVDHAAGELRLRDTKTGPRMVPLTAAVGRVLDGVPRSPGNPWVFPGQREERLSNLYYYWKPIRAQAGLGDVRLHDLRHSYASRALALGENLSVIGGLLGHREVATTARYAHLMRETERAAAARVGDSIGVHVKRREG
ncbi:MAG: tyrosine-type recombinase/integrase [Nitrospinae bacterium]|nr:tyrosine-type recombinase/integrase [Nitrospinota bacterium]